jgi:acetyl esterase/lipase
LADQPAIPSTVEFLENVEFGSGGGRQLRMHILRPKQPPAAAMPVIVYVHGGWWRAGSCDTGLPRLIPFAEKSYFGTALLV